MADFNANCFNSNDERNFSMFNRLKYDDCNSKEMYKGNNYQLDYRLGMVCNRDDLCEPPFPSKCPDGGDKYINNKYDIESFFNKSAGTPEDDQNKHFKNTRGYSTIGPSIKYTSEGNKLTSTENTLNRSCLTNLNYINQYTPDNLVLLDHSDGTAEEFEKKLQSQTDKRGSNNAFTIPIQNKVYYRTGENYIETQNKDKAKEEAGRLMPRISVREKGSQYYERLGLINNNIEKLSGKQGCTVFNPEHINNNCSPFSQEYIENTDLNAFGIYPSITIGKRQYNDEILHRPVDSNSIFYDYTYVNNNEADDDDGNPLDKQSLGVKILKSNLNNKLAPYDDEFLETFFKRTCITK